MPYKAKRPCKYPGCPRLTDRDYCAEHISQARYEYEHYRRDPETKKRYGSRWRKIRALYVKAHPLCEECLKHGRTVPVEQVHSRRNLNICMAKLRLSFSASSSERTVTLQ